MAADFHARDDFTNAPSLDKFETALELSAAYAVVADIWMMESCYFARLRLRPFAAYMCDCNYSLTQYRAAHLAMASARSNSRFRPRDLILECRRLAARRWDKAIIYLDADTAGRLREKLDARALQQLERQRLAKWCRIPGQGVTDFITAYDARYFHPPVIRLSARRIIWDAAEMRRTKAACETIFRSGTPRQPP